MWPVEGRPDLLSLALFSGCKALGCWLAAFISPCSAISVAAGSRCLGDSLSLMQAAS